MGRSNKGLSTLAKQTATGWAFEVDVTDAGQIVDFPGGAQFQDVVMEVDEGSANDVVHFRHGDVTLNGTDVVQFAGSPTNGDAYVSKKMGSPRFHVGLSTRLALRTKVGQTATVRGFAFRSVQVKTISGRKG